MIKKVGNWQWVVLIFAAVLFFFIGVQYGKYTMTVSNPQIVTAEEQKVEELESVSAPNLKNDQGEQKVIKVHIAGAVFNSGLYEFKVGSRVDDAVKRTVPLPEADLDRLNLARLIKDGERIYVPYQGEQNNDTLENGLHDVDTSGKINLNSCTAQKLEELPGIGPALASRIIEYRNGNGPFSTVDQLANVSGIGDKKLEAIRELVTVY